MSALRLLGVGNAVGANDFDVVTNGPYDLIELTLIGHRGIVQDISWSVAVSPDGFTTTRAAGERSAHEHDSGGIRFSEFTNGTPAAMNASNDGYGNAAGRHGNARKFFFNLTGADESFVMMDQWGIALSPVDSVKSIIADGYFTGAAEVHTDVRLTNDNPGGSIAVYGWKPNTNPVLRGWEFVKRIPFTGQTALDFDLAGDPSTTFRCIMAGVSTGVTNGIITMVASDDGGSTFLRGAADYKGAANGHTTNVVGFQQFNQGNEQAIHLNGMGAALPVNEPFGCVIDIFSALDGATKTKFVTHQAHKQVVIGEFLRAGGTTQGATVHDAVQIEGGAQTQTFDTGFASLYRLKVA